MALLFVWLGTLSALCQSERISSSRQDFVFSGLEIEVLGKRFTADSSRVIASQNEFSLGGSTSVRNIPATALEWKEKGYFQRNRDLGQVFYVEKNVELASIILRTGPSEMAVLDGCQGAEVFIQFFEVEGEAIINNNGTTMGMKAKHGFSDAHRCDDFLEGVSYVPLPQIFVGKFPSIPSTNLSSDGTDRNVGKLVYMRWKLAEALTVTPRKRYAFLVGFLNPGTGYGFTLANTNKAGSTEAATLIDTYPEGWGIRREGDGSLPPIMREQESPPEETKLLNKLVDQSVFEQGNSRFLLSPTTDGYPDVDTYRDLEFILER